MRIIAGSVRGRRLTALPGEHTRPTGDRVKESLFSILHRRLPGAKVLDLFSGSGALGLEALSRGAAFAVLVDDHADCIAVMRENARLCGFADRCAIRRADALEVLDQLRADAPFDLVFADPPYAYPKYAQLIERVFSGGLLAQDGVVACEHAAEKPLSALLQSAPALYRVLDCRNYGKAAYTFLECAPPSEAGE